MNLVSAASFSLLLLLRTCALFHLTLFLCQALQSGPCPQPLSHSTGGLPPGHLTPACVRYGLYQSATPSEYPQIFALTITVLRETEIRSTASLPNSFSKQPPSQRPMGIRDLFQCPPQIRRRGWGWGGLGEGRIQENDHKKQGSNHTYQTYAFLYITLYTGFLKTPNKIKSKQLRNPWPRSTTLDN